MLWRVSEVLIFVVTLIGFLAVMEVAFRLGRRHHAHREVSMPHIGALQGALLGLLALLLGFTFAMAVQRFDARRSLILQEANAIGTAYLRTQFLSEPQRQEAARLLKSYVASRIEFHNAGIDEARIDAARNAAARLQSQLWTAAVAAAEHDAHSEPIGLFIESLNEVIDISEERRAALDNHVPETVLILLFVASAVALCFVAYGSGLSTTRRFGSNVTLALLITLVLITIIDIDRPRRGMIQVKQDSLIRLQADMEQSVP
jgi:hypothetical protein